MATDPSAAPRPVPPPVAGRVAGGGPAPRWSPRRLGHHRYLWWAGALVLVATLCVLAFALDGAPGAGIGDTGGVAVVVVAAFVAPVLLGGFVHELVTAVRRRARDDVREYGTGKAVRATAPDPRTGDPVRLRVAVDHVDHAARVRAVGDGLRLEDTAGWWHLRSGPGWLAAEDGTGRARHLATRRAGPARYEGRWEFELDGRRRFWLAVSGLQCAPRRTLLELGTTHGTAWRLHVGEPGLLAALRGRRWAPHGRLPEDLSPAAVAFCLWHLGELAEHQERVRGYGRAKHATTPDPVADGWTGHF